MKLVILKKKYVEKMDSSDLLFLLFLSVLYSNFYKDKVTAIGEIFNY